MNSLERLCVIDDDPVFTFLLKKMIEKEPVASDCFFFENGQDAIDYLTEYKDQETRLPELILLDINMPILDGWQFIDEFAKLKSQLSRNITIFMISSSTDTDDYNRAMATGYVDDYIRKPIYAAELQKIVQRVLSKKW
ncbi:response regulator [Dyadobacter sp. CY323]|uniref:response regulator n=1 Tax=Dyadobacter sp. CY323 TaxID=2907302 RepID=UPI001F345475|nr:response regulator [Dyadobacter sp. CY323]MCE6988980.1 response regulator [Dyadobacter sp. CY323]